MTKNSVQPSWTWKAYLSANAKFLSPKASKSEGHITSDIKEVETLTIPQNWRAMKAKHDPDLVNNLIIVMEDYLGDRTVTKRELKHIIRLFEPVVDNHGEAMNWCENSNKADARDMVSEGAIQAAASILQRYFGVTYNLRRSKVIVSDCTSSVDYALVTARGSPVLVEIEAPVILQTVHQGLLKSTEFDIEWCGRPSLPSQKILRKLCAHMGAHRSPFMALTSHQIWLFLQLHPAEEGRPCHVTYSFEMQKDNTRPFRTFMGMMIASYLGTHVKSGLDEVSVIPAVVDAAEHCDQDSQSNAASHGGVTLRPGTPPPASRDELTHTFSSITLGSLQILWNQHKYPDSEGLILSTLGGNEDFSPFDLKEPIQLVLESCVGWGSTGTVYQATLAGINTMALNSDSRPCYVLKTSRKGKGNHEEEKRLRNEIEIYRRIERARREGKSLKTPRCYGVFESELTVALAMDFCEGQPFQQWSELSGAERMYVFKAIQQLHEAGIIHGDLDPRNVVRHVDGTIKLIDFSSSKLHSKPCSGIAQSDGHRKGSPVCTELTKIWQALHAQ